MYLRTTTRRNADGTTVRYVALAHNYRDDGGRTRTRVLANLGRADLVDADGLRRLARSIGRWLGDPDEAALADAGLDPDRLRVVESRPLGPAWLLDALWARLGVADALRGVLGARRFGTDVERVLFALVANRAIAPCSKLAAAEWATQDVAIAGLEGGMTDDQAYRALDLLVDADVAGEVQRAVFFAAADLLNLEVDLILFDTTSTYFETDTVDGLRRRGHSKDHRPDLPQVVIGLAVTKEGIPVRVWVWPGNTTDTTVLVQVRDELRDWSLGRVITVVDRGFSSEDNLAYLRRGGGHWIAGQRMRDGGARAKAALSRQGRYHHVKEGLRVKEVRLDDTTPGGDGDRRWIVCHNPDQATRDAATRDELVAVAQAELDRIATARARTATRASAKRRETEEAAHTKAECALRDHGAYGRYVRQLASGRLRVDRARVRDEQRLDGKFLLSTSDPHLSAADVALGYKNLLEAEDAFRDLKSELDLRPVFHRLEQRIHAHVLVCWLALLLIRVAEHHAPTDPRDASEQPRRLSWPRMRTELGRLHQVRLAGDAGSALACTELTSQQQRILGALNIPTPPPVTALDPT